VEFGRIDLEGVRFEAALRRQLPVPDRSRESRLRKSTLFRRFAESQKHGRSPLFGVRVHNRGRGTVNGRLPTLGPHTAVDREHRQEPAGCPGLPSSTPRRPTPAHEERDAKLSIAHEAGLVRGGGCHRPKPDKGRTQLRPATRACLSRRVCSGRQSALIQQITNLKGQAPPAVRKRCDPAPAGGLSRPVAPGQLIDQPGSDLRVQRAGQGSPAAHRFGGMYVRGQRLPSRV